MADVASPYRSGMIFENQRRPAADCPLGVSLYRIHEETIQDFGVTRM